MRDKFKMLVAISLIALVIINTIGMALIVMEQKRQTKIAQLEATIEFERLNYEQQLQQTKANSPESLLGENIRGLNNTWLEWGAAIRKEIAETAK